MVRLDPLDSERPSVDRPHNDKTDFVWTDSTGKPAPNSFIDVPTGARGTFQFKLVATEEIDMLHHFKPPITSSTQTYTVVVK